MNRWLETSFSIFWGYELIYEHIESTLRVSRYIWLLFVTIVNYWLLVWLVSTEQKKREKALVEGLVIRV